MSAAPAPITTLDLGGITLTYVPDGELRAEPSMAYPSGHEGLFGDGLDVVGPHFPDAAFRRYDPAATPSLTACTR